VRIVWREVGSRRTDGVARVAQVVWRGVGWRVWDGVGWDGAGGVGWPGIGLDQVDRVGSGPLGRGGVQFGGAGALGETECEVWMTAHSRHLTINGSAEGTAWRCSRRFVVGTPMASSEQGPNTLFWRTSQALASRRDFLSYRASHR